MSSIEMKEPARPRQRLSRDGRHRQLMEVAWRIVREEGTDALTLPRLAEQAGVAKPVVYDHFATRPLLLAALYQDFDSRQTAVMDAALQSGGPTLAERATIIASSYVDCVLLQGREIPGIIAALASSPELEKIKREYQAIFMEKCRLGLLPSVESGRLASPGLWAMLGAAEALSNAAACGDITVAQAEDELFETIVAMVRRRER